MKTIWILPGGGSYCVYTAGNLVALHKLNLPKPNIIIASSGSSATAAYFLAEQYSPLKNVWVNFVSSREFSNPLRFWRLMNIDYLIDIIVKIKEPLNLEKALSSNTLLLVPMSDSQTGKIRYFSKNDSINFYEILRAANAAPVFSGFFKDYKLSYKGRKYLDTRVSSRPNKNIEKAIQLGAERIIVFDNYHRKTSLFGGKLLYKLLLYTRTSKFRRLHLKYIDEKTIVPKNIKFLYLKPKHPLEITPWNNQKNKILKTFSQGFDEIFNNEELKTFYKK